MHKIERVKPHDLDRLMDEILAAVPASRRVRVNARGINEALPNHLRVSGLGDQIIVEFADDIPVAAIDAVIAAHDPNASKPKTTIELEQEAARDLALTTFVNGFDLFLRGRNMSPLLSSEKSALKEAARGL